jgi:hypothetical protein
MRTPDEFWQTNTGWDQWTHHGRAAVRSHEHPLSTNPNFTLPAGTEFIVFDTYLGDPDQMPTEPGKVPFWVQHRASTNRSGLPLLTVPEFNNVLRSAKKDLGVGTVHATPREENWRPHPQRPRVHSRTLNVVTDIEVPQWSDNAQLRATTFYPRKVSQDALSVSGGDEFFKQLEQRGFPPDSFHHLRSGSLFLRGGHTALSWLEAAAATIPDQEPARAVINRLHNIGSVIMNVATPRGVFLDQIRTSRHGQPPRR